MSNKFKEDLDMTKLYVVNAFWAKKDSEILKDVKRGRYSYTQLCSDETIELVVLYSNNTYETFILSNIEWVQGVVLKQDEGEDDWYRVHHAKPMTIDEWMDIMRLRKSNFTKRQVHKYIEYKVTEWNKRVEWRRKEGSFFNKKPYDYEGHDKFIKENPAPDLLVYSEPKEMKRSWKTHREESQ